MEEKRARSPLTLHGGTERPDATAPASDAQIEAGAG